MQVDVIIVGQGVAGTMLAESLLERGKSVMILDDRPDHVSSTAFAGGVLHHYGKGFAVNPSYKRLLEIAIPFYKKLEVKYQAEFLSDKSMFIFKRIDTLTRTSLNLHAYFHYDHAPNVLNVFHINVLEFLNAARKYFVSMDMLQETKFDPEQLEIGEYVQYKNICAKKIIFCDGVSFSGNKWFSSLKFIPNRGDILLLEIEGLPEEYIYDSEIRLVHRAQNIWWCGSNQLWELNNMLPDMEWRLQTESVLQQWLKLPFNVKEHLVIQRPTTPGQIPHTTLHPELKCLGIFNGMGSRGLMQAPHHAIQFSKEF